MSAIEDTYATQLANIEKRTGKTLAQLTAVVKKSGLSKHGELRDMLKRELGMGHGDANLIVHVVNGSAGPPAAPAGADPNAAAVDAYYSGAKAALRPIHDAVMAAVGKFGAFEIAPKKTYLSLRRKKQFVMVGPATNTRVEVGLNMQGVAGTKRLEKQAAGKMCQYIVKLTDAGEVDRELIGWMRTAFDQAE